jgi:hypothetical protein
MRYEEMKCARELKVKKEREARLKKEREARYAAYLERESTRIKRENKILFERVAAEARAIREEKEEEERKAKTKAKGPCLSE